MEILVYTRRAMISHYLLLALIYAGALVAEAPLLKGVLLHGLSTDVRETELEIVEGVQTSVDLPGGVSGLEEILAPYLGHPFTDASTHKIQQEIIDYYRLHNRPVVDVEIPPQVVESGVLQLVIYESRLGAVRSFGNRHFSNRSIERAIRLKKGDRIQTDVLIADLNWMNKNPFRTTELVFTPAEEEGTTDIELVTQDRLPWGFYTGGDNTGVAQSGNNRWFGGFNWGNCWGLGHIVTYQFTTGSSYEQFWAHSLNYTAPLPWHHTLDIYGGYAEVEALVNRAGPVITHGTSAQASTRYEIPLPPAPSTLLGITAGFDWKWTNTNLLNGENQIIGKRVNLTQLMVGYQSGIELRWIKTSLKMELFGSPGAWLPDQENSHFETLRPGAKNVYIYGRASLAATIRLPYAFSFDPTVRCQLSNANLLASEQMGVGGYNSVRGYEEREVNGDNALILNGEIRTPPLSIFKWFDATRKHLKDDLRFLIFADYGYARNHLRIGDEPLSYSLIGIGPGVRYVIHRYFTARCDYGWRLHNLNLLTQRSDHKVHFGLILSW